MQTYTYKDLKNTGLKLDQYHTLLNFFGINWKLGKGTICTLSEDQYNSILKIINEYGTGLSLASYIKEQNSLRKYGLTSPNKLESKRNQISKKLKEKAARGDQFGFVGLKKEDRWNYKSEEERLEEFNIKMTSKYGPNWKDLTLKERSRISRVKNNTLQGSENVQQKRKQSILKGFEDYLIFNELGYNHAFKGYLLQNNYLSEKDFIDSKGFNLIKKEKVDKIFLDNLFKDYMENKKITGISIYEDEICKLLDKYNIKYVRKTRKVIKPKELDIYIPAKNVAIELNGLYWHTTEYVDKNQHLEKTKMCEEKNIRLIHIFEDDFLQKRNVCESIILSALGIYDQKVFARNCKFEKIDRLTGRNFADQNHLHGSVEGGEYFGLYFKDDLVQVIQIGKSRFKKDEFELYRMCTKLNTQVIGGFSKLMKNQPYEEIVSYIDKSLYSGKGYEKSGWIYLYTTSPNYTYYVDYKRENRLKYQKHKLKNILENFDPKLTEVQNMRNNQYYQIFDCGNIKVKYSKKRSLK